MNLKKHCGKHVLTIVIFGVFAFLAGGSTYDAQGKTIKAFKEGDYNKVKKIGEGSSDIKKPTTMSDAEACWYLGEVWFMEGDEEKALDYKIKAYNTIIGDYFKNESVQKNNPDFYNRMINDSQIKKILAKQEKEKQEKAAAEAKKGIVGTWSFYTINKDGKSYSKSNLKRYPQQVVFKENGTGYVNTPTYPDGADDHSNFTWSYQNGELTTSLTAMRVGMNEEGYVWCNCSAITKNMGLERVFVFFKKN
ncbi:Lipocalin-like domain-containing protein [Treponema bryantii]|uniref:Lipocalin-like domain-containing protein n=1 Tax=Treponema bryantii TaxID=163 RepID=A0A1I3HWM3_9SPIR|nr:lipocalin family protein [Treponema bryantii]SFI39987.1 Lipocalin-like domain-containing protein [Treponema bryantii]